MKQIISPLMAYLLIFGFISCAYQHKECDMSPEWVSYENSEDLEHFTKRIRTEYQLPGVAIGIINKGTITTYADGYWTSDSNTPLTVNTPLLIGSCSKNFTALLIANLVQEGHLSYQTTMSEVFRYREVNADLDSVTIAHLLTHTSGLPQFWTDEEVFSEKSILNQPHGSLEVKRSTFVDSIISCPPSFQIGTYHYSNAGYIVLAEIIQEILKMQYENAMDSIVFHEVGMSTAQFGYVPNENTGTYSRHQFRDSRCQGIPLKNHERKLNPIINSAGALSISINDFVDLPSILLDHYKSTDTTAYKKMFVTRLYTNDSVGICYGLQKIQVDNITTFGHTGSDQSMRAAFAINPKLEKGVVFITNIGDSFSEIALINVISELIK